MVWSQTNRVFKIKTMRFFGWNIWDAAAIGWFSCIQCRGEKKAEFNGNLRTHKMNAIQWGRAHHIRADTYMAIVYVQLKTKPYKVWGCATFRVYFFSSRKWEEKKANVLFSDFRVFFFISMNVSLCTLIKKYTLNRTNNHGQRRQSWQKKNRICSASLQIRVKFKSTNWK